MTKAFDKGSPAVTAVHAQLELEVTSKLTAAEAKTLLRLLQKVYL